MKLLAKAAATNDRILFEWRTLHDIFFDSVRWTSAEAEATRDGLFVKTLELGPMGPSFRLMRHWPAAAVAKAIGSSRLAPFHSYQTFLKSAAFGFLQMTGVAPSDFVEGGRRLQRVWLTATSLGLGFQPMAGMLYLLARLQDSERGALSSSHVALLRKAVAQFRTLLHLSADKAPILLFRIGRGAAPSAGSLRRPLSVRPEGKMAYPGGESAR